MDKHEFGLIQIRNFVDFSEVEPYKGPIKKTLERVESNSDIDLRYYVKRGYSFIEHQVSLEDSLLQILSQPSEFSILNLDKQSRLDFTLQKHERIILEYMFDLST